MKTYRHDLMLFFAIPAVIAMTVYGGYQILIFEGPLRGGEVMRYGFAAFAGLFSVGVAYLFLNFGVVRYYFTPEGLMVKKLGATMVRAWEELKQPSINPYLKYVVVRDRDGKVVILTSLDFFTDIREFVQTIQTKAGG